MLKSCSILLVHLELDSSFSFVVALVEQQLSGRVRRRHDVALSDRNVGAANAIMIEKGKCGV